MFKSQDSATSVTSDMQRHRKILTYLLTSTFSHRLTLVSPQASYASVRSQGLAKSLKLATFDAESLSIILQPEPSGR